MYRQLSSAYNSLAAQLYGGRSRRRRKSNRLSAKAAIKAWKKWLKRIRKRR